mgnify:CR=1 FL=1
MSKQDYATPRTFIEACRRRFGPITMDLAAHAGNAMAPAWMGPGAEDGRVDSLQVDWAVLAAALAGEVMWLNPEYKCIRPWAQKCLDTIRRSESARILMLVPNGMGSDWYRDCVHRHAPTLVINGRITFRGESAGYPKDHLLVLWGWAFAGAVDIWPLPPEARSDTHSRSADYLAGRC